jgi:hypothetical protein
MEAMGRRRGKSKESGAGKGIATLWAVVDKFSLLGWSGGAPANKKGGINALILFQDLPKQVVL